MNLFQTRSDRTALRCGLAAACGLLAVVAATTPARGQCDPQELANLIASDAAAGDALGYSVAVSGETAVVGATGDDDAGSGSGSAYVFIRAGDVWTQQAKLTASDAAAGDAFGYSVAVSGDTVVVGATGDDDAGSGSGSAYVFVRAGGVWTQQAKLTAYDAAAGSNFGYAVALSGDTAVVGARGSFNEGLVLGSAYVFTRSGTVWTEQAKLTASDAAANDWFGSSVALSGDTAAVGAERADHAGGSDAGSAYVFVKPPGGWVNMTETAKLSASDAAALDHFGGSAAISGDTVVVGAEDNDYVEEDVEESDAGSAYIFVRSGAAWTQQAKLNASDAREYDSFGSSVALSGDVALIGAVTASPAGCHFCGSAYVFARSGSLWTQQAKLTDSDAAWYHFFGGSVAISGETAVVGAVGGQYVGEGTESAYVFELGCDDDGDGVLDLDDNCPLVPNPEQADCDSNGSGDACQPDCGIDSDSDGLLNCCDNCPTIATPNQTDGDADGVGDVCDDCIDVYNPTQIDTDGDGLGDLCDNCPNVANPGQEDGDSDSKGDACPCPRRGDMNDDGVIDGTDIQLFVEAALGG